jgi:hypothetical protein
MVAVAEMMAAHLLSMPPHMPHFLPPLLPQLVALDIEPYMAEFAGPYFAASGLAGHIRPMIGSAQDSMLKLAEQGERCAGLTAGAQPARATWHSHPRLCMTLVATTTAVAPSARIALVVTSAVCLCSVWHMRFAQVYTYLDGCCRVPHASAHPSPACVLPLSGYPSALAPQL